MNDTKEYINLVNDTSSCDEEMEPKISIETNETNASYHEEEDEEYVPSGTSDSEWSDMENDEYHETSVAELLPYERNSILLHRRKNNETTFKSPDPDDTFDIDDANHWTSREDKINWIAKYKQADEIFYQKYKLHIDTTAHPDIQLAIIQEKRRQSLYLWVLILLTFIYIYHILSMYQGNMNTEGEYRNVTSNSVLGNNTMQEGLSAVKGIFNQVVQSTFNAISSNIEKKEIENDRLRQVDVCAQYVPKIVTTLHNKQVEKEALEACDKAVELARTNFDQSLTRDFEMNTLIQALVLRADVKSLLSMFDEADEDYLQAKSYSSDDKVLSTITLKQKASVWLQWYMNKNYQDLHQDCDDYGGTVDALNPIDWTEDLKQLATIWLDVFNQKKKVLDALTASRAVTLNRLHIPNI